MPGPSPLHQPDFPEDFLRQARALLKRRTVPFHLRQRASLVCLLCDSPDLPHEIAARHCQLQAITVRKWRKRWADGEFVLEDRSGRGRKPAFSPGGTGLG